MKKELIYQKKLSALKDLQEESTVNYYLIENENGFGIELAESSGDELKKGCCYELCAERNKAEDLLTYLFENSIYLTTYKEIVCDLLQDKRGVLWETSSC